MFKETFSVMRNLPRVREIITILIRHGMGNLVQQLGLAKGIERISVLLRIPKNLEIEALETPIRVRRVFEELGPTFIKLGQVLATRVDLFAPEWIREFEKLQNHVPPVAFEQILHEIEKALGCSPYDIFDDLDPQPIGSASIAQVHRARLRSGEEVVLKVRRPGIVPKIEADLRIIHHIATLAEFEFPELRRYQPIKIVEEFSKSLRQEMDLFSEARNLERFSKNFSDHDEIIIPSVWKAYTSVSMNVQSYLGGIAGNDLAQVDATGLNRKILAERGANAVLKMVLIDGYFHADPHPGNVKYFPENRLGFLDFGMVGKLSQHRRNQIVDLMSALSHCDERGILNVVLDWIGEVTVDENQLSADLATLLSNYESLPLKDISLGHLLSELATLIREHQIRLPPDLTLFLKALISLEGLGRQLDPDFHLLPLLKPFVHKAILARYDLKALLVQGKTGLLELIHLLDGLPQDLVRLVRQARRGTFKVDLDLKRLERFGYQIAHSSNRLTMGIVTGSLIIGSSIAMTVQGGPTIFNLPAFGLLGYLLAFFNTIWIIISIWISRKKEG